MMGGYGGFGFGPGGMGLGMLLFWGLVILVIVLLVRGFAGGGFAGREAGKPGKTALDILSERYARGEIDKAEFEQKRGDLRGS